jgi:hypothetical protein
MISVSPDRKTHSNKCHMALIPSLILFLELQYNSDEFKISEKNSP